MASFRSNAAYRIAVTYAAIYAWTILLLGGATFLILYTEFEREPGREIARELARLESRSPADLLNELRLRQSAPNANRFTYVLLDGQGRQVDLAGKTSQTDAIERTLRLPSEPHRELFTNFGSVSFADKGRLVVVRNTPASTRMKRTIIEIFVGAFLAVLTVSAVSAAVLAWYLRSRLRPISATADAIAAGDIMWRVPVREPGDEFDEAGRAINVMLDRISGLMENLRQVSSDIAHDLRKPLMRLLLQTDRLGSEKGAEQRIFELGDEMISLFNGILRIAEVEGGGLERSFELVDLSALMNDVAESFAPALIDSGHSMEWTIDPEITVMGNRELLAQVASNLLDNARVHTPPDVTIRLGLSKHGPQVRLWVEDDGPGVSEEDRDKLLQRFFRAEASRTTPGNGLGLSLAAAVAHAHGGRVLIEDAMPGLRVIVCLPSAS